jgi:dephospho-CoA kinase
MLVVGLTGGIGSGKTTFAGLLAEHGAQIIDADALGRDALEPGRPAWSSVVDQFGEEVLVPGSMVVDRKKLAGIVFSDKNKLVALNAIVHPVIFAGIAEALERLRNSKSIAVVDAAILVETGMDETVDVLIVVTAGERLRVGRLLRKGLPKADIEARMAAQRPQEELVARADIVVSNNGSMEDLATRAGEVWEQLQKLEG